ncbi:MAG TPA: C40 family peptidase [Bacteroidia bacterium]|jgi:cell wall-associated NlpC family hydrolase|nr:C40 family peptidase [Bacteroidia bacterium]
MFGICNQSIVPCRKEAAHRSEMVTQLLFGEHFTILSETEGWLQIRTAFDEYDCWISNKQFLPVKRDTFKALEDHQPLSTEPVQLLYDKGQDTFFPLVIGSTIPFLKNKRFSLENHDFEFSGEYVVPDEKHIDRKKIISTAFIFLNAPYLWGGRSPFGIDCSGFTQLAYKLHGFKLPRDAHQQAGLGLSLSFVEEAQPGDLAFFDNEEGKIIHVGIVLEDHKIIHAAGKVRVDKLDHYGIFNLDTKKYSHHLRVIKKIL